MTDTRSSRDKSKSPERALAGRLLSEVGLCPAQARWAIEIVLDFVDDYWTDLRPPGVITHTAVSEREPPGKPIKDCKVIPVLLTVFDAADLDVQREKGTVELRALRLYRFAWQARKQGGLLSHEDLSFLLTVDVSTIKDLIQRLRERELFVPTRGAVKDIGPDPSHKRAIATMLATGMSTRQIRAATGHSESSIGRYQRDFALVLYALHTYPDATDDQRALFTGLSRKIYDTYLEVARLFEHRQDCRPHLERLRRRYETDPSGVLYDVPQAKKARNRATQRLKEQKLATVIRQTIQEQLGVTRHVAQVVGQDLVGTIQETYREQAALKPGEAVIFVDAHDPSVLSGERVADRPVIPVVVPLYTEKLQEIWRQKIPASERRARIATRIGTEIVERGGAPSVAKLAEFLHVTSGTLSADLRKFAVDVCLQLPIKGFLEDAGPTLTHKDPIVALDQCGLTGAEISWLTRHAPASRDQYIETYRRAEVMTILEGKTPGASRLARILGTQPKVAQQYIDLLQRNLRHLECVQENAQLDLPLPADPKDSAANLLQQTSTS